MRYLLILFGFFSVVSARAQNIQATSAATNNDSKVIRMRCSASISSSEPLLVVDGVVKEATELKAMNPNDIQSIDILKGKSAVALYGSKGENGVIIIKTKECKPPSKGSVL